MTPHVVHGEAMRVMNRTARSTAIFLSFGLWLGGCVNRSALMTWQGGEQETPVNTVMSLRYYLCEENWAAAAQAIRLGSEYGQARTGDPTQAPYWRVPSPIAAEGMLAFPLGPEDAIGEAQQVGAETLVEIRHARRYEKDPRPRALVLEEQNGLRLIVAYRNS